MTLTRKSLTIGKSSIKVFQIVVARDHHSLTTCYVVIVYFYRQAYSDNSVKTQKLSINVIYDDILVFYDNMVLSLMTNFLVVYEHLFRFIVNAFLARNWRILPLSYSIARLA
mgnify:CR=1 FL=1